MSSDKRRSTRKAAEAVEVCCSISNKEFKAFAANISEKGICMRTLEDVKRGDKVKLNIRLFPQLPSVKNILGNVVWKDERGICGLRFKRIDAEALEVVQGFVNN
jgi:hypothetical protein